MSQKTVIERVDVQGAHIYLGMADDGSPMYSNDGNRVMQWLCDAWRFRFNANRSNRYIINKNKEKKPLSEHPDTRTVKTMRVECPWIAAVPTYVIQSPDRIENTQWFAAIARRKTNITHHRKAGRMPSFLSRKHDDHTFACWYNNGQNALFQQVNRNHGIVTIKGQNPKDYRDHGTRFTIRIHIRVSQPIRPYTGIRVNWTKRTLVFTNTPLPIKREQTGMAVGVDVGVAHAAAQSNGMFLDLPKTKLAKIDREIRRRQRAMARKANLSGKTRRQYVRDGVSQRYARERAKVADLYAKKHRIITDCYQKYTTGLVRDFEIVCVEALQTANMTRKATPKPDPNTPGHYLSNGQSRKRGLNRSMRNNALGMLRSMLEYKTKLEDTCTLVQVNPAYTSQTCFQCKHIDPRNRESQAAFQCVNCGHEDNADTNAALNILEAGLQHLASTDGAWHGISVQDMLNTLRGQHATLPCEPQHA
ncbi:RNA-guided endonuclease InsQ/TnpB family protein [Bifidobacterium gallicum]|nr:RNA-guided endonuclease TnpB family protein [Bifidobacterium gallicum]